jgi:hypothetical protein
MTRLVPLLTLALLAAGCNRGLYPVKGVVVRGGAPVAGLMVSFYPQSGRGPVPYGVTDATGTFTLCTHDANDGAPPGEYRVAVASPAAPSPVPVGPNAGKAVIEAAADPARTPLRCTVPPAGEVRFDLAAAGK